MKKIDAIIHARNWQQTRAVLEAHQVSASLREIKTFGRSPAQHRVYRGTRYVLDTTPELELSALVRDEILEPVVQALLTANTDAEVQVSSVECFTRAQDSRRVISARAIVVRPIPNVAALSVAVHA